MANMSYCRFRNTENDFFDCVITLGSEGLTDLSREERSSAQSLYKLAQNYIDYYETALEDEAEREDDDEDEY